ncbi:unnamed protein product [Closterium sp. NIES-53]
MVGAVGNAGVVDTLEARLEDARRRHEANEYRPNLPLAVIEAGIHSVWAEEHPARPISPRPMNNEGGIDVGVNACGDEFGSNAGGKSTQQGVIHADEVGSVQAQGMRSSAAAGSSQGDVGKHYPNVRAEFRAVQLLTFTVILRCCLPGVQIALKSCREYVDAGHRAWHFIESTYQVTNALYIGQLEEQLSHIRMGEEETATDYCNRARQILATMRMAGVHYSMASYLTHVAERPLELLAQVKYAAPVKQGGRPGQRGQSGGGGSSGWKPTKDADKKKSAKDSGRGGGSPRWECWLCGDPDHLSFECPDRSRNQPRKEKKSTKSSTSAKDADYIVGGKGRDDKEASCSLVGIVEPTVSLAPDAGEDFQAMAAAMQANPAVVLLDSGCSHHLMGTKEVFVDQQPSDDVKHVRNFNRVLQDVQGRGTVALQGEAGRQVLIPDVLYVLGVRANLLSAGQLKENGVKLQEDGDGMLLVSSAGDVLGRASYTGQVLCTDLRPCSAKSTTPSTEVVALQAIVSMTKSTQDRLHARLAHVGMNTIRSSAKHEVAFWLDLKSASGADLPCVLCVGRKLAWHTFPDQGSDADDVLAVMHVDLCGPFRVAANDSSLYFLLLKDRKTRYVWVRPVAKKSDALQEFVQWLVVTERQTKKSLLMLRSDRGGEFLGKQFTDFVNGKGIVHDLTCPYTPQQNGMAEREMRTVVESVRTMLLHMGVQHHLWHLALWQAVWVCNWLEWSTLQPGTTPYQLLTGKKPDLSLARVWCCMAQFLVPEQECGGKLKPKAKWGLQLGVSEESKGWELLDIADNQVVTTSDVVFYENMSLEVWKSEHGPASGWTPTTPPTETSTATLPVLANVGEPAAEDVEDVSFPSPSPAPYAPPLVADLRGLTRVQSAEEPTIGEKSAGKLAEVQQDDEGSEAGDDGRDAKESTDSDVVEVQRRPRQSGRFRRPPKFYVPAAFTTAYNEVDEDLQYDDAEEDEDFSELVSDMHADLEHRWDISTMTVKEALASGKGKAVKAAMEEEIRSLISMGTWELVERPPGVNIMKNRWGFTQVYGADYDETYAPVSSYVTLRIFLSIVAVLDLNLMQLDTKNTFLQSKLDRMLCLDDVVLGAGWEKSQVDTALYFKVGDDKVTCWVLVSVDDLLAASSSTEMLKELKELLEATFKLRDISSVLKYLGLETCRKLGSDLTVRSDQQWHEVDRCLAYLANTRDTALEFGSGAEWLKLVGYVDANDASDKQNWTSTGGYVFVFGGAAISWSSQRIKCVTLSSTESEYVAANEADKEGLRLCFFLAEFRQLDAGTSTVLRVDNKLAITVAKGMGLMGNLKHMERRQAWLQHMVKRGNFSLRYIPTTKQPADFLTKALHYPAFNRCSVAIGQVRLIDVGNGDNDVQQ